MNWLTWYNPKSGNRTTTAHAAENMRANRTFCGWTMPTLTAPAPRKLRRCQVCAAIAKKRPQQHFLSKDGKTKYLVSRNFPEDA